MTVHTSYLKQDQILRRHRFQKNPFSSVHMSTGNNVYKNFLLWRRFWKDAMSVACARLSDSRDVRENKTNQAKIRRAVSVKGGGAPSFSPALARFVCLFVFLHNFLPYDYTALLSLSLEQATLSVAVFIVYVWTRGHWNKKIARLLIRSVDSALSTESKLEVLCTGQWYLL